MILRTETAADYEAVYRLNFQAFGNREDESKLVEKIRSSEGFISELSIVAEEAGHIVGHILLSKAIVKDEERTHDVIVLAPIAVRPDLHKQGIGGQLMQEGFKRSAALGYSAVLLIGHPDYYPKFGFVPARQYGLELKQFEVPDEVFMVRELTDGALHQLKGELLYPDAFF